MIPGLVRGAEVPGTLVAAALTQHSGPQPEVAGERLQDMLPGTNGIGVAHDDGFARHEGSHGVGDDPVGCPVATADDVAGAGRCCCRPVGEEALAVRGRDQLRAALAGAVRIAAAHGVRLSERPIVFVVLVALVAGDDHDRLNRGAGAGRFEHVHGSHHVGLECLVWLRVRPQDQGLGGQVEDHRRLRGLHFGYQAASVADVGDHVVEPRAQVDRLEQTRLRGRIERVAGDLRAKGHEPLGEPRPLEAGVAGNENAAVGVALSQAHLRLHRAG